MVPGPDRLLRQVVEVHSKPGQVFRCRGHSATRREAIFAPGRVPSQQRVAVRKVMVHTKRALILEVGFVAYIVVIVRIRRSRRHHHVRHWQVLEQKAFKKRIDPV